MSEATSEAMSEARYVPPPLPVPPLVKMPPRKVCHLEVTDLGAGPTSGLARCKFRCLSCGLTGKFTIRPVERLDDLVAQLRAWHDTVV